jgi:hypothetical protein
MKTISEARRRLIRTGWSKEDKAGANGAINWNFPICSEQCLLVVYILYVFVQTTNMRRCARRIDSSGTADRSEQRSVTGTKDIWLWQGSR